MSPESLIPFLLHRMHKYSQYVKGHVGCIVGPWQGPGSIEEPRRVDLCLLHFKDSGIFGGFGLPILSVLGWQSEDDCGFVVELIVGYDGKFLLEYNTILGKLKKHRFPNCVACISTIKCPLRGYFLFKTNGRISPIT